MPEASNSFSPRRLRKAGAARRAAILEAATLVFLEKGFEGTSLADIIHIAGGSRRMIYDQFRDKEGLFEEMMAVRCAEMLAPMNDPLLLTEEPATILKTIADRFLSVMTSEVVGGLRRIGIAEGAKYPAIAKIFFERGVDPAIKGVSEMFEILGTRPDLAFEDPRLASVTFLSMLQGDMVDRLTARAPVVADRATIDRHVHYAIDLILTLSRSQAAASPVGGLRDSR